MHSVNMGYVTKSWLCSKLWLMVIIFYITALFLLHFQYLICLHTSLCSENM